MKCEKILQKGIGENLVGRESFVTHGRQSTQRFQTNIWKLEIQGTMHPSF